MLTIKKYNADVAFLMSERARYRKLLEIEYSKLATSFRESVKKFNDRLTELYLLRLKVFSTTLQERVRHSSKLLFFYERVIAAKSIRDYR